MKDVTQIKKRLMDRKAASKEQAREYQLEKNLLNRC